MFNRKLFKHEHERQTADYLVTRHGWNVHARPQLRQHGVKDPDTMVRKDGEDKGTVTELKHLEQASKNAICKRLSEAGKQVNQWGGGDAVIDGRKVGLTDETARRHVGEAVAEIRRKGKRLPSQIYVILGDGSMIRMRGE